MFRPGNQAVWTLFPSGNMQIRNWHSSSFKMIPRKLGHPWGAANLKNKALLGFGC